MAEVDCRIKDGDLKQKPQIIAGKGGRTYGTLGKTGARPAG